ARRVRATRWRPRRDAAFRDQIGTDESSFHRYRRSRGWRVGPHARPGWGCARACTWRGTPAMRVWQPGGHLMRERGAEVEDWSWGRTRRRVLTLARLTRPYRVRTAFSVVSLLAATATALAPPFLSK